MAKVYVVSFFTHLDSSLSQFSRICPVEALFSVSQPRKENGMDSASTRERVGSMGAVASISAGLRQVKSSQFLARNVTHEPNTTLHLDKVVASALPLLPLTATILP